MRNLPIKRKVTLIILLTTGMVLLLACSALFVFQTITFEQTYLRDLTTLSRIIAENSSAALQFDDKPAAESVLGSLRSKPYLVRAYILHTNGEPYAQFGSGESPGPLRSTTDGVHALGDYRVLSCPIELEGKRLGTLELWSNYSAEFHALLRLYGGILALVLGCSLALASVLSWIFQRFISGPILRLAETARTVAEKQDYTIRAAGSGRDEVGLLTDAFNRMLAQIQLKDAALNESEQRFALAVNGARDGIWDWDLARNHVYFSKRWKEMLGYSENDVHPSFEGFRDLVHDDDREAVLGKVSEYLGRKTSVFEIEFRMRRKDSNYHWILSRGAALFDSNGAPFRMSGSHSDIMDRKKAEAALRFSQQKFEVLVNSINGIVWEADPMSLETRFVSSQSEKILGYPPQAWIEDSGFCHAHIDPRDVESFDRALRRCVSECRPCHVEYRMRTADGRVIWMRNSINVTLIEGKADTVRGIALDITEQKEAAEKLENAQQELIETSRRVGMAEIATGVLHNVGNVLNSVNVSANLIVDALQASKLAALEKVAEYLKLHSDDLPAFLTQHPKGQMVPAVLAEVTKMLRWEQETQLGELALLTRNIDHIKQIVAMQQSYAKVSGLLEPLDVEQLVRDAIAMNGTSFHRNGISVIEEFEPVPRVLADKHKILQILINLVRNAKRALEETSQGHKILTIGICLSTDQRRVQIRVKDTGVGMPPETLIRIFAHGFITKKDGHGFGLHSCALAAKEMGGDLRASSDGLGTGALFTLELPYIPKEYE